MATRGRHRVRTGTVETVSPWKTTSASALTHRIVPSCGSSVRGAGAVSTMSLTTISMEKFRTPRFGYSRMEPSLSEGPT